MDAETALLIWAILVAVGGVLMLTFTIIKTIIGDGYHLLGGVLLIVLWSGVTIVPWYILTLETTPCEKVEFNETEYVPVSCVVEWDES